MQLDSLYQEIILDHYKHPQGRGLREPYDAEVHHVNPTCGDEITLRVRLTNRPADGPADRPADGRSSGHVEDVSYEGMGCSISQAAASVLYELLRDKPLADALRVHDAYTDMIGGRGTVEPDEELLEDAVAFAGVSKYPGRVKCALLPWMAFKDAVARVASATGGDDG